MQGYIVKIIPTKSEDLILKILTPKSLRSFYRFYGARHSTIALGRKIDFDEVFSPHFLPQARNILHLFYQWEKEYERVYAWQNFVRLLERHLSEVEEVEEFYFNLLEKSALHLERQNPLRALLESYVGLLAYEGRLLRQEQDRCFLCDGVLDSHIVLAQSFLFAHPHCVSGAPMQKQAILEFLHTQKSLNLDDSDVEKLWKVLCLGF